METKDTEVEVQVIVRVRNKATGAIVGAAATGVTKHDGYVGLSQRKALIVGVRVAANDLVRGHFNDARLIADEADVRSASAAAAGK